VLLLFSLVGITTEIFARHFLPCRR